MLELRMVSGGYNNICTLHDITLSAANGAILSIVGPNGSGKSTLLRIMGGLQPPYRGQVLLDGDPLCQIPRKELARRLSYLPQVRNIPSISVNSMVMHGRFPYLSHPRRYSAQDKSIAEQAMEQTGITGLRHRDMAQLSGGERQKVYLAMLLAQDTQTILMDEPATYLDIARQLEIMLLARALREKGKTVVMVLHDINLALCHSDSVLVMQGGRMAAFAPPAEVYESGILDKTFGVQVLGHNVEGQRCYFYRCVQEL